jgi:hypothetical protein
MRLQTADNKDLQVVDFGITSFELARFCKIDSRSNANVVGFRPTSVEYFPTIAFVHAVNIQLFQTGPSE